MLGWEVVEKYVKSLSVKRLSAKTAWGGDDHSLAVGGQLSDFRPIRSAVGYNKVSYPAPPADLKTKTAW